MNLETNCRTKERCTLTLQVLTLGFQLEKKIHTKVGHIWFPLRKYFLKKMKYKKTVTSILFPYKLCVIEKRTYVKKSLSSNGFVDNTINKLPCSFSRSPNRASAKWPKQPPWPRRLRPLVAIYMSTNGSSNWLRNIVGIVEIHLKN